MHDGIIFITLFNRTQLRLEPFRNFHQKHVSRHIFAKFLAAAESVQFTLSLGLSFLSGVG